jgi:hypothetical protein
LDGCRNTEVDFILGGTNALPCISCPLLATGRSIAPGRDHFTGKIILWMELYAQGRFFGLTS